MVGFLTLVEPVVIINTVGSSFYDAALTLAVYNRSLETAMGQSDQAQALSSRFFFVQSSLASLLSLLSTVALGRLADRRGPRVLLAVPQVGSVLSKALLLLFLLLRLPLWVLYLGAALHGLSGGSPAYWGGLVSVAALRSGEGARSLRINTVELFSGLAGIAGGLVSGYIYRLGQSGVALTVVALLVCAVGLLYSLFLLDYPSPSGTGGREGYRQLAASPEGGPIDRSALALLFASMILFVLGMSGAENVLCLFVLKPPLAWDSVWAGYGRAATNAMYLTSFLGVLVLSRWLGDRALILLGIVSNCTGMAVLAFASQSWVYFLARGIMMFACIPMPTIKSQLSKITDAQLYGRVFGWLQSCLALTDLLSVLLFTSIYPLTLDWYSGFSFLLSCLISYLSVVPILWLHWRRAKPGYTEIPGRNSPICTLNTADP
ncbi:solute carrier family 46 member 2 [Lepisosteus oculatus]|uniref:solute carrier family 46 member 2 n=1 Tax=Lepisosteus oculatus TaxID=7918 RepID=UPI003720A150